MRLWRNLGLTSAHRKICKKSQMASVVPRVASAAQGNKVCRLTPASVTALVADVTGHDCGEWKAADGDRGLLPGGQTVPEPGGLAQGIWAVSAGC